MWYRASHPFTHRLLVTTITGVAVGLALALAPHVTLFEPDCEDRLIDMQVANTCPTGTYLELASYDDDKFIICHCKAPRVIQFVPPTLIPLPNVDVPKPKHEGIRL